MMYWNHLKSSNLKWYVNISQTSDIYSTLPESEKANNRSGHNAI